MSSRTEPVIKLILFVGLGGILVTILGAAFERDLLALGGIFLVATCIHAITHLVK